MLLRTTGANRTRIHWSDIRDIGFPYPDSASVKQIIKHIDDSEAAQAQALRERDAAMAESRAALHLNQDAAHHILDAFKPPR